MWFNLFELNVPSETLFSEACRDIRLNLGTNSGAARIPFIFNAEDAFPSRRNAGRYSNFVSFTPNYGMRCGLLVLELSNDATRNVTRV